MIILIRAGDQQKPALAVSGTRGGDVHPPAVAFGAFVKDDLVVAVIEDDPILKIILC